jgi:hypothetical protein
MPEISEHFKRLKLLASSLEQEASSFIADSHISEMKDTKIFLAIEDLQNSAKKTIDAFKENLDFKPPDG